MKTTLNKIWAHSPCDDGWEKLIKYLGKSEPDDTPLSLLTVLESNGLDDTLWALRAVDGHDRKIRMYACKCARHVLPVFEGAFPGDLRPRRAIETAASYTTGAAAWVTVAAARDAAEAAAKAAAWAAARAAAWAAAWAAARDVAGATTWGTGAAARGAEAARAAAWAAAWVTVAAAGDAAAAARDAAAAERDYQKAEFIKTCTEG
jgi:hypothetical protein